MLSLGRYFRSSSRSRELFPQYKDKAADSLRVDEELEKLAGKVMAVFDDCIKDIDNVDNTVDVMARAAAIHKDKAGFASSMYMVSVKL